MNILFVHEIDWSTKVVFDFHLLIEEMVLRGHKVSVMDYRDKPQGLGTEHYLADSRTVDGLSVRLVRPGYLNIPGLKRLSYGVTSLVEANKTLQGLSIDIVVIYSVPTNGLSVLIAAKGLGIPIVFRSIDYLHKLVGNPLLTSITKVLEKVVYRNVDCILPDAPCYSDYVKAMGAKEAKVGYLPAAVDTVVFSSGEVDRPSVMKSLGLEISDQVAIFMGSLFDFSGLDLLVEDFSSVLAIRPRARLVIVGEGPQRKKLESIAEANGISSKVRFTGRVPYLEITKYLRIADVGVNTFPFTKWTSGILPGKIFQYLAVGLPVVSTPQRSLEYLKLTGLFRSAGDSIVKVLSNTLGANRRELESQIYVKENHSVTVLGEHLEKVLEEVIERAKG